MASIPIDPDLMGNKSSGQQVHEDTDDYEDEYSSSEPEDNQQKNNGEVEVPGEEFDRLAVAAAANAPQERPQDQNRNAWDETMEAEFDFAEMDAQLGIGGVRRKKTRRARPDEEPSPQVKEMLGRANQAYVEANLDEAIVLLTEIVRIEPTIRSTWFTLATISEEMGNIDKSMQFKIVGAHLTPDAGDLWKDLAIRSKDRGFWQQAIYCYGQAIKANKSDVDAIWDRAILLQQTGNFNQAATAFNSLLRVYPNSLTILRNLCPIYSAMGNTSDGLSLLSNALEHWKKPASRKQDVSGINRIEENDIALLADLYLVKRRYQDCATAIKTNIRWFQNRANETIWDSFEDDREYDIDRSSRNDDLYTPETKNAPIHTLSRAIRTRLGVARLHAGMDDEAIHHFNIIRKEPMGDDIKLWGQIADALHDKKIFTEALEYYADMAEDDRINTDLICIKMAHCHKSMGNMKQARELLTYVVQRDDTNQNAKMKLADICEEMGDRSQALTLLNDVLEARRKASAVQEETQPTEEGPQITEEQDPSRTSFFIEENQRGKTGRPKSTYRRPGSLTIQEREQMEKKKEEEYSIAFSKLDLLESSLADQNDQESFQSWIDVATDLVDGFRQCPPLFPTDSRAQFKGLLSRWKKKRRGEDEDNIEERVDDLANRLESSIYGTEKSEGIDHFRGRDFDSWAALFIKYAFALTKNGEALEAIEVLQHVSMANVMKNYPKRARWLRLALVSVLLYVRDYHNLSLLMRRFMLTYQRQDFPTRLFQSLFFSNSQSAQEYSNSQFQKFLLRQVRATGVMGKKNTKKPNAAESEQDDEMDTGNETTEISNSKKCLGASLTSMYGNMMLCSKSYQSAFLYLLQAHQLNSEDPLVFLSLGLSYIHRGMQRQVDNRHYTLAQAFGLMSTYRKLRRDQIEVEYNFGRMFQQIGLKHLAVKHFHNVLNMVDKLLDGSSLRSKTFDKNKIDAIAFSRYAAYNLQLIYVTCNEPQLAKEIIHRWISV